MGYYDNHYPPNPHRRNKSGWLIPVLLGIIIGILLVVVAVPTVLDSNLFSNKHMANDDVSISKETGDESGNRNYVTVDISTKITEVVEEVSPAVVGISNLQRQNDFWQQSQGEQEVGTGSGVIYKKDDKYAYVITNYHVIEGADELEVVLYNDIHLKAKLLGGDLFSDLAVLQIDGKDIQKTIEMGSSDNVKVGEPAIAIGNPLGHMFAGSVTLGIISGKQRTIPQDFNRDGRPDWQAEVIQTDAAINPGNSGGALINAEGQLIGINSMKINEAAVEGIGFSIPIDTAIPVVNELEKTGKVTRPYLGVEIYSLDDVPQTEWTSTLKLPPEVVGGVYVWSIEPLSPADQAGMQRLDVITALDGKDIMNMIDLRKVLFQEKKVGEDIEITYYRNGERHKATVTLGVQKLFK